MEKENRYLRIGTTYYKIIERPTISKETTPTLTRWNRETITQDFGKKFLSDIPKYEAFCCIPDHLNYQQEINGFYNLYHEIPFRPNETEIKWKEIENYIPYSLNLLEHLFGKQINLALDYLKILFMYPVQMLPVVCLVSKERATGKTTFLKWLKAIFGMNMTYVKGDSFSSQFNSDWSNMLLIAIDEVFFDKKEITERLKFLSTTDTDKMEAKGKDREEVDFFGKFILCSNNEDNFIQIDENEIRFWVIKVNPLKSENTEYMKYLKSEIPHFLSYLLKRPMATQKASRMWFLPELLKTKALDRLIYKTNNKLESKMVELLYEFFESLPDEEIKVVPQDILNMLNKMFKGIYWTRNDVRNVLKKNWKLKPQENSLTYTRYDLDYSGKFFYEITSGRFFTINRAEILEKFDEFDENDKTN